MSSLRLRGKLEVALVWGPRQVGKTTLLDQLELKDRAFLDDLSTRDTAQNDPAFFLDHLDTPCLIDEVQYAPNLFPALKLRVDTARRERLRSGSAPPSSPLYFLTGSNRLDLDERVKESLAGRAQTFALHGLSVREIIRAMPATDLKEIVHRGGFPELYVRGDLLAVDYLNDYILSFVEKDIARSAGIGKLAEFQTVLQLCAARVGQFVNMAELSALAGVDQKTIKHWLDLLERNHIIGLVPTFATNLSKRVVKQKKLFFYDTGLCARLQGHRDAGTLWASPHIGALFESLTFSEIVKTRSNFLTDWRLSTWRTRDKAEIDFVLETGNTTLLIEAKLGIHRAKPFDLDREARKAFTDPYQKVVVNVGEEIAQLPKETLRVGIRELGDFLLAYS